MYNKVKLALIFLSVIILTACGGGGGGGATSGSNVAAGISEYIGLNMATTQGFILAPSGTLTASLNQNFDKFLTIFGIKSAFAQSNTNTIYSLNSDNSITEVNISTVVTTDQKTGLTTTTKNTKTVNISVIGVFDTLNYIFLSYSGLYRADGKSCGVVPVRKSDGALFCLSINMDSVSPLQSDLQTDLTGNTVYIRGPLGFYKVLLTDPTNPTVTKIRDALTESVVNKFIVNPVGDVFLREQMTGVNTRQIKILKSDGGFQNIATNDSANCFSTGINGDTSSFYFSDYMNGGVYTGNSLYKLTKNIGQFQQSLLYTDTNSSLGLSFQLCSSTVNSGSKVYFIAMGSDSFVEAVNGATPLKFSPPGMTSLTNIYGYNGGLVIIGTDISGNSIISKFDTTTHAFLQMLTPGEYSINFISVNKYGDISFAGNRASDGLKILGNINKTTNSVSIVNSTLQNMPQSILRLN